MKLQTKISVAKQSNNLIDYKSSLLLIGSCFVENIGDKLEYYKFQNLVNPIGILFHPIAIENFITRTINQDYFTENDVFFYNEQWHCFDTHSDLSSTSKEELLNNLNKAINKTYQQLIESSHIVITLGTSWFYRFIESDKIVANCHKKPQKQFLKELLSPENIEESLNAIIALIKSINPNVSVIFTVSPVRHLKDGFIENTQSKAHLISAIHQVVEPRNNSFYFPSYEIMMDELRNYRFYKEDMIHPNQLAIIYIWEKFKNSWISSDSENIMEDVDVVQKGLAHKPFNPNSKQHQGFLKKLKMQQSKLLSKYPQIKF